MEPLNAQAPEAILELTSNFAALNVEDGGGPFYAMILGKGKVFRSGNRVTLDNDPTAHAEVSVIRKACRELETFDLTGYTLYSSCEPCPMCLGASMWANLENVYFNASRHDAELVNFRDAEFYERFEANANDAGDDFLRPLRTSNAFAPFQAWLDKEDKTDY